MFRLFNYGMSPLFSIVPFVTTFSKGLPAEWKCYVNKLQIAERDRTLPINLAALRFARRVRLSIQHETWSRTDERISCEQMQPARRIRHGQTIGRDPCASREIRIHEPAGWIAWLQDQIAGAPLRIAWVQDRMTSVQLTIAWLQNRIAGMQIRIAHVQGQMAEIQIWFAWLQNRVLSKNVWISLHNPLGTGLPSVPNYDRRSPKNGLGDLRSFRAQVSPLRYAAGVLREVPRRTQGQKLV